MEDTPAAQIDATKKILLGPNAIVYRSTMGRFTIVAVFVVGACGGEENDADAKRCERVRDRIVDLRLENATNVDRAAHRVAMRDALGADFVDGCQRTMTAMQQKCVLGARDLASATACSSSR